MLVQLTEEQRQACVLALAILRSQRPGWDQFISEIVVMFRGEVMYTEFLKLQAAPEEEHQS